MVIIIIKENNNMKNTKRDIRKEKLAKLFFEMGMDISLVSKVCGIEETKLKKMIAKNN
jgi:hypothetical protein